MWSFSCVYKKVHATILSLTCFNLISALFFLQRFPSLTPEIMNRCSRGVVAFCRRNHSPLRQRRMESDADLVAATTTAGGTILCCRKENQYLTRTSLSLRQLQAEPFSAAAKIRIGRGSRCCHASCRRAILLCCYENWKRTRKTVETTNSAGETLHRFSSLGLKSRITARWMAFQGKSLHRFSSLGLKSRIDARKRA